MNSSGFHFIIFILLIEYFSCIDIFEKSIDSDVETQTSAINDSQNGLRILRKSAKKSFRMVLGNVTPVQRKKQLQRMREKIRVDKISESQSKVLHKKYRKVMMNKNPPSLDLFEINEQAGLNDFLFQGDMNLVDEQISEIVDMEASRRKRQILNSANFWPDNTVYYYFEDGLDENTQLVARLAMKHIQKYTCIRFQENNTATNRVKIINGSGCYSNVGMTGGEQTISLGSGCQVVGIAAHELSHALGVFHSQMRSDRDQYVTIDLTDVPSSSQSNFVKYSVEKSSNVVVYEYGGIMHYSGKAFVSSGGVDSIVPKDSLMIYTMGGRIITFLDMKLLNLHYTCSCLDSPLNCTNGGYANPGNCEECNCPYGYSGTLCDLKMNYTCGATLIATSEWQQENFTFGNDTNQSSARIDFTFCNHWIQAPEGKKIQFRIDSAYNTQCSYGCTFNGIEPKLKADQTITQTRYCCDEFNGEIMSSEVNPLPIFTYNRYYVTTYSFSYRYVESDTSVACEDLSDKSTCSKLKSNSSNCSTYDNSQLKVMCATSFDLCGKSTTTPCADRFPKKQCKIYKKTGRCTTDHPLNAEFSCSKTCGFCDSPV